MPILELDFEVYCGRCGDGLCNNSTEGRTTGWGQPFIKVEPCEKCLNESFEDGKKQGAEEALEGML